VNIPCFSLITANCNVEHSITDTLQSARAQTCRDFENVVVDDASTDGTLDVVRQFTRALPIASHDGVNAFSHLLIFSGVRKPLITS